MDYLKPRDVFRLEFLQIETSNFLKFLFPSQNFSEEDVSSISRRGRKFQRISSRLDLFLFAVLVQKWARLKRFSASFGSDTFLPFLSLVRLADPPVMQISWKFPPKIEISSTAGNTPPRLRSRTKQSQLIPLNPVSLSKKRRLFVFRGIRIPFVLWSTHVNARSRRQGGTRDAAMAGTYLKAERRYCFF